MQTELVTAGGDLLRRSSQPDLGPLKVWKVGREFVIYRAVLFAQTRATTAISASAHQSK